MQISLTSKILFIVGMVIFIVLGVSTFIHMVELRQGFKNDLYLSSEVMLAPVMGEMYELGESSDDYDWIVKVQSISLSQIFNANKNKSILEVMLVNDRGAVGAHSTIGRSFVLPNDMLISNIVSEKNQVLLFNEMYTAVPLRINKKGLIPQQLIQ